MSSSSHTFLDTKELVKTFVFLEFVYNDYLSAILDHAMASIALEDKGSLIRVHFKQAHLTFEHVSQVF